MSPRKPPTEPDAGDAPSSPVTSRGPVAGPLTAPAADENADVTQLSYEDARDELARIVSGLEGGQVPLEESMRMWRRGEALAAHCTAWLDGAQRQIEDATAPPERPGRAVPLDDPSPDDEADSSPEDEGGDEAGERHDARG